MRKERKGNSPPPGWGWGEQNVQRWVGMSGSYRVTQIKEVLNNVGILLNNQHGHGFH